MAENNRPKRTFRFLRRSETSALDHIADAYPMPSVGLGMPPVSEQLYDGTAHEPVKLMAGAAELRVGEDYDITYTDNVRVGTASFTATGKGAYTGTVSGTFEIVEGERLRELEPNLADEVVAALWAPTASIVNPFQLNWALAENALANGAEFDFNTEVTGVVRDGDCWLVSTPGEEYRARCVINAAGVYADSIHNMVSDDKMEITPRRGQYFVLDTTAGRHVGHTVFQLPTKLGKGVLVTPTTAGNLLVGPTAEDIDEKEGTDTTAAGLQELLAKAPLSVKNIPFRETITSFSGLRAHRAEHDFAIGEVEGAPGFIDCAAIESPGLTSAPAIGEMVAEIVDGILHPEMRDDFIATREGIPNVEWATDEQWAALIEKDPAYGRVICRCRKVTEAQIVSAIHHPLGARSLDGIKRRTEACMGRCQAGFCTPKIMEILDRELSDLAFSDVTKAGPGSELIVGRDKELEGGDVA